jgi:hypothetical protein
MKLADGRRMNVSEWAGGYTKEFAKCLSKGAEAYLSKHYTCVVDTFAVRKPNTVLKRNIMLHPLKANMKTKICNLASQKM